MKKYQSANNQHQICCSWRSLELSSEHLICIFFLSLTETTYLILWSRLDSKRHLAFSPVFTWVTDACHSGIVYQITTRSVYARCGAAIVDLFISERPLSPRLISLALPITNPWYVYPPAPICYENAKLGMKQFQPRGTVTPVRLRNRCVDQCHVSRCNICNRNWWNAPGFIISGNVHNDTPVNSFFFLYVPMSVIYSISFLL